MKRANGGIKSSRARHYDSLELCRLPRASSRAAAIRLSRSLSLSRARGRFTRLHYAARAPR